MPIDAKRIDQHIEKLTKLKKETQSQIDMLWFVRDKMMNGSDDDKKLIYFMGKLTLDSINMMMEELRESIDKMLGGRTTKDA